MRDSPEEARDTIGLAASSTLQLSYSELYPREGRKIGRELLPDYLERVGAVLPNFPRGVLADWLYRHSQYAVDHYKWLGFERLRFEKQTWGIELLLSDVQARRPEAITLWRGAIMTEKHLRKSKLGTYMISHGTWPQPPIILDNSLGNVKHPRGEMLNPLHLMEGHHRLGYLHALVDNVDWTALPSHNIWVVTCSCP